MKALVCREFGTADKLALDERNDPVPSRGEVLVDIKAAGINFPDLLVISGQYQVKTAPPFVPGSEASGVVAATGEGVTRFKPGDRVIITPTLGAFAEKCLASENHCMHLPENMTFEQGAGFTVTYATSYHALRQCTELRKGETVLVLGAAGGVGTTAVEIAKAFGARVIAAASSDEKLAFARETGADEGINYSTTPLREAVKSLTDGKGVDVVYDPVGGDLALQAFRSLAWQGRYLVIGFASGDIPAFPANIALLKEARITGVWWGTWGKHNPDTLRQNLDELTEMIQRGDLKPRVTGTYPVERYVDAFAAVSERRAQGKVVLTFG
ncbi:NADPH:quinone oxidoreductase family protein [Pseudomonadota bacterium]